MAEPVTGCARASPIGLPLGPHVGVGAQDFFTRAEIPESGSFSEASLTDGRPCDILANLAFDTGFARMIERRLRAELAARLDAMPAVAVLGPHQIGKTTLAPDLAEATVAPYLALARRHVS